MAGANDYGTYGSVPTTEATGAEGGPVNVRATGNDFGEQVGEAKQNLGSTEQKVGDQEFDQAMAQQKIVNETTMTNADIDYSKKAGAIRANYMSLTGLAATQAFPQYQNDLEQARLESRQGLNPAAARGYDLLSTRTTANHIIDGSTYAASQTKAAQRDSGSSLMDISVDAAGDPTVANNPERFHQHLGDIQYAAALQVGDPTPDSGLKEDSKTGMVNFDDTPQGIAAKATHDQTVEHATALAWENRFQTLSNQDPVKAKQTFDEEKNSIPPIARVNIEASLQPKVQDQNAQAVTSNALNQANADHEKLLLNPNTGANDAINTVLKNEGGISSDGHAIYGIDKNAHPAEFLEAQTITSSKGAQAGKDYATQFYKDQYWDKNKIGDLPANTQAIVMDGAVNHSQAFTNQLVTAAKDGASPQQLIDMRRNEYNRLATANPDKYGASLQGWNNRLDSMQQQYASGKDAVTESIQAQKAKPYATNADGSPMSRADYYAANKDKIIEAGNSYAQEKMPGDLEFKNMVRARLENQISTAVSAQSAQYKQDNGTIQKGIVGSLTKGNPPSTYEDLRAIPGMADVIDRSAVHSPEYFKSIDTQIAKMSHQNVDTNSPNGYDTIMRTLEPHGSDNPNAISSQDHLDKLLGRNDGTGINKKDYNDAKPLLDADQTFKDALSTNMKQITNANGNVDGKGQDRAMLYYQQVMQAKAANDRLGDKALPDAQFVASLGTKDGPPMPAPPSRMQQLHNWAAQLTKGGDSGGFNQQPEQEEFPTFGATDDPDFLKLDSGKKFKTPDGKIRTKK